MHKQLLIPLLALGALTASASGECDLQGTMFRVDTLQHVYIGPGVTQTHLQFQASGRMIQVYAISGDLKASDVTEMRVVLGQDSCKTGEAITSMARRKTTADRQIIGGINGDFFITSAFAGQHEFGNQILGYPNMSCVIDGMIAAPDMIDITSRENALIIGSDGWWIDATDMRYRLLNNDGSIKVDATAINYPRRAGEMVVYNSYAGKYTKTDQTGRELVLRLADGASWRMNASVKFVVDGEWRQGGNSRIPEGGLVISCGPNYSNEWIDGLKDGDIVKFKPVCSLPAFEGIKPDIKQVIGGDVRILKEGVVTTEAIRWINTPSSKYSRSLVGYDKDRTTMVMAAVDAGTANTTGMTYYESADLMRYLGCWDALDFDGGGSTVLWTQAKGIVNVPRDGAERAVGNGLFVAMNTPADNNVASIRFADYTKVMPRYGTYSPVIYGYNQYGQLVDTDVKGFYLEAPAELGTTDGHTLFATGEGMHALTARYGNVEATVAVLIDNTFPTQPKYASLVIDDFTKPLIELQANVQGEMMPVAARAFEWTSSDPSIVTVDAEGRLTGLADGQATVTGVCGDATVTVNVDVQCPVTEVMAIDPDADADTWKVSRSSISEASLVALDNGFAIDYKVSSTRGTKLTLAKNITLWSLPEAIQVRLSIPDGVAIGGVTVNTRPDNAERYVGVKATEGISGDCTLLFPVSEFADPADPGIYPIHFVSLAIEPTNGSGTYHIDIPGIEARYAHVSNNGVDNVAAAPEAQRLNFSADGLTVSVMNAVGSVELYTLDGRLAARAKGRTLQAPAPGLYVLRAGAMAAKIRL